MKKMKFMIPALLLSQVAFSQVNTTNPPVFDGIGQELVERIKLIQSNFNYRVGQTSACFPEYKTALDNSLKRVESSIIAFQKGMESDKKELEATVGKEMTEYKAIQRLLDGDPQNVAYQKLLADKKKRLDVALNAAKTKLEASYRKRVNALVFTFPLENLTFDLRGHNYERKYRKLTMTPYNLAGTNQLRVSQYYSKGEKIPVHNKDLATLDPKWAESQLTAGGEYRSWKMNSYGWEEMTYGDKTTLNASTTVFNDCKTAGCVYLLSEQVKSWLLSMQKVDMSIAFKKDPIDISVAVKGVDTTPGSIKLVLDHVAEKKASGLPIGVITPACDDAKVDATGAKSNSLSRENNKEAGSEGSSSPNSSDSSKTQAQ